MALLPPVSSARAASSHHGNFNHGAQHHVFHSPDAEALASRYAPYYEDLRVRSLGRRRKEGDAIEPSSPVTHGGWRRRRPHRTRSPGPGHGAPPVEVIPLRPLNSPRLPAVPGGGWRRPAPGMTALTLTGFHFDLGHITTRQGGQPSPQPLLHPPQPPLPQQQHMALQQPTLPPGQPPRKGQGPQRPMPQQIKRSAIEAAASARSSSSWRPQEIPSRLPEPRDAPLEEEDAAPVAPPEALPEASPRHGSVKLTAPLSLMPTWQKEDAEPMPTAPAAAEEEEGVKAVVAEPTSGLVGESPSRAPLCPAPPEDDDAGDSDSDMEMSDEPADAPGEKHTIDASELEVSSSSSRWAPPCNPPPEEEDSEDDATADMAESDEAEPEDAPREPEEQCPRQAPPCAAPPEEDDDEVEAGQREREEEDEPPEDWSDEAADAPPEALVSDSAAGLEALPSRGWDPPLAAPPSEAGDSDEEDGPVEGSSGQAIGDSEPTAAPGEPEEKVAPEPSAVVEAQPHADDDEEEGQKEVVVSGTSDVAKQAPTCVAPPEEDEEEEEEEEEEAAEEEPPEDWSDETAGAPPEVPVRESVVEDDKAVEEDAEHKVVEATPPPGWEPPRLPPPEDDAEEDQEGSELHTQSQLDGEPVEDWSDEVAGAPPEVLESEPATEEDKASPGIETGSSADKVTEAPRASGLEPPRPPPPEDDAEEDGEEESDMELNGEPTEAPSEDKGSQEPPTPTEGEAVPDTHAARSPAGSSAAEATLLAPVCSAPPEEDDMEDDDQESVAADTGPEDAESPPAAPSERDAAAEEDEPQVGAEAEQDDEVAGALEVGIRQEPVCVAPPEEDEGEEDLQGEQEDAEDWSDEAVESPVEPPSDRRPSAAPPAVAAATATEAQEAAAADEEEEDEQKEKEEAVPACTLAPPLPPPAEEDEDGEGEDEEDEQELLAAAKLDAEPAEAPSESQGEEELNTESGNSATGQPSGSETAAALAPVCPAPPEEEEEEEDDAVDDAVGTDAEDHQPPAAPSEADVAAAEEAPIHSDGTKESSSHGLADGEQEPSPRGDGVAAVLAPVCSAPPEEDSIEEEDEEAAAGEETEDEAPPAPSENAAELSVPGEEALDNNALDCRAAEAAPLDTNPEMVLVK